MDKIANPHDKYFRTSMRDFRVAKEFLKTYLPDAILEKIQWETLQQSSNHHLDKTLKENVSDVLYEVKFGNSPGYISILVEHQSTVDRLMPFRILQYCLNIMNDFLKKNPGNQLPLVVPIVFYTGKSPYHATTDIFQLFGEHEYLARNIFLKPFQLIDLGRIPDDQLKQYPWAGVMQLVQKHIWMKSFLPIIRELGPMIRILFQQSGEDYIYSTIKYLYNTVDTEDVSKLTKIISGEVPSDIGDTAVTIAEKLREMGREEGRHEGRNEGEASTKQSIARRLLEEGADIQFVAKITGCAVQELEQIKA